MVHATKILQWPNSEMLLHFCKDSFVYTEWTDDNGESYARMLFDHSIDPLELNNLARKG
jgi:hypothetical protein